MRDHTTDDDQKPIAVDLTLNEKLDLILRRLALLEMASVERHAYAQLLSRQAMLKAALFAARVDDLRTEIVELKKRLQADHL